MLQAVRDRLDTLGKADGRHYLLTIAAADGEAARGLDLPRIVPLLDWINLMTYDFFGSLTPNHGSSCGAGKIRIGTGGCAHDGGRRGRIPRRGRAAGEAERRRRVLRAQVRARAAREPEGLHQAYGEHAAFLSWRVLQTDYVGRNGYVRHWDADAQAAWLWNEAEASFVTY